MADKPTPHRRDDVGLVALHALLSTGKYAVPIVGDSPASARHNARLLGEAVAHAATIADAFLVTFYGGKPEGSSPP